MTHSSSSSYRYSLPYKAKNTRNSGCCIAGFFRRILCISSTPSCSYDRLEEEEKDSFMANASATPGVVARLMGLESLPLMNERISSTNSVDLFRKSRSTNARRRKIIPTYQELEEDDKFFILSFDHEGECIEFSNERRRSNSKSGKRKKCKKKSTRRAKVHESNKENQGVDKVSEECLDYDRKIVGVHVKNSSNVLSPLKNSCRNSSSGEEIIKNKVKQESSALEKLEKEGGSEDSSPNSVLEFPPDPGTTAPSGNISRLAGSKPRRTLSEELENFSKSEERRLIKDGSDEKEKHKVRMRNRNNQKYTRKLDEIGKLAAREMVKWSWLVNENSKDNDQFKEIGRDVASAILDHLLFELLINFS